MSRMTVRLMGLLGTVSGLTVTQVAAADDDLFVCRFDATTGLPDTGFNSTGCSRFDDGPNGRNDKFYDVDVDSTGRVVVCGSNPKTDGTEQFLIGRYLSNGLLDPNFSPANFGFVQQNWPAARACATDSSGRIVAAVAFGPPANGVMVVRLNAFDGSRDSSFGPFGFEWIPTSNAIVADVKITAMD